MFGRLDQLEVPMRSRWLTSIGLGATLAVIMAVAPLAGQAPAAKKAPATKTYTAPRLPDGHPDLMGIWANNSAAPFERPKEVGDRQFLTDAEVAALSKAAAELFNGDTDAAFGDAVFKSAFVKSQGKDADIKAINGFDTVTGNYNQFWLVDRSFDNRTSVVTTPDGRIPPVTDEAKKRSAAAAEYRKAHPADGPEDLPLGHRCVNFGLPKIGAGYNSYHQIVQSAGVVGIFSEMAHDIRIIPTDGRAHVGQTLRQWNGDSRGRWEGDTLVVETTNFSPKSQFRGSSDNLHLVERFTRVAPDTLNYEIEVSDPTTWTKSWTAMIPMKSSKEAIYEYACHEGNEGLPGALSGQRTQDKLDEAAARKGSR
jgi:hypothetical protein